MRSKVYLIRGLSFIEVVFRFATVGSRKDSGIGKTRNLIGAFFWAPMRHRNSLGLLVAFDASQQLLPIAVESDTNYHSAAFSKSPGGTVSLICETDGLNAHFFLERR